MNEGHDGVGPQATGQQQVDALSLYAAARGIPGAPRPELKLPGDNASMGGFATAFWTLVREKGVFRRDASVWLINGVGRLMPMDPHMLLMWGERHVEFTKTRVGTDASGETVSRKVSRSMPVEAAKCLLAEVRVAPGLLQEIVRVNAGRMPILRQDGSLSLLPTGYDGEARTYTLESGIELDESVTIEQVREFFGSEFREFPLGDGVDSRERSVSVMVSCLLTLFCAGMLRQGASRPMFGFNSNAQRSGKSLLAKYAVFSVFGRCAPRSWIENKEEFRKDLDTAAATGEPVIFYDNVKCRVDSADLEKFVSSPAVTFRPMGKNTEEMTVANVATVLVTGNNLGMSTDLAQRTMFVNLFVNEADPQARNIERLLDEVTLADVGHRREVLSALWAMVRHWDAMGRPLCKSRLAGFEEWSRVIGGIVEAAGFGDPLARPNIKGVGDNDGQRMQDLVHRLMTVPKSVEGKVEDQWDSVKGPATEDGGTGEIWRSFSFAQLCDVCAEYGLFDHYVPDTGSEGMRGKERSGFGKYLARYIREGRVFRFQKEDGVQKVGLRWNGEEGRAKRFLVGIL